MFWGFGGRQLSEHRVICVEYFTCAHTEKINIRQPNIMAMVDRKNQPKCIEKGSEKK